MTEAETALHSQMLIAKDRLNHCSLVMQDVNQYPFDVPGMKKLCTFFLPGLNGTEPVNFFLQRLYFA